MQIKNIFIGSSTEFSSPKLLAIHASSEADLINQLFSSNSFVIVQLSFYRTTLFIKGNGNVEAAFGFPGVIRFCLRDHLL